MEVRDPEGVEDAGQEADDDPGVEDEPRQQEAARLPVQSAHTERVTKRAQDWEHQEDRAVQKVVKVLSEGLFRVCDRGYGECEAGYKVAEVHHSEALEDPARGGEHTRAVIEAVRAQQVLACSSNILHHSWAITDVIVTLNLNSL